jgi:hypothetical protein
MCVVCRAAGADAQPAVLAAVLAVGLSRRPLPLQGARVFALCATMVLVPLIALGVGRLLRAMPPAGAAAFVAGMFASVWLRNFGPRARQAGALVALPLIAMLIVPPPSLRGPGGALAALSLTVCAGLVALVWVVAIQTPARRAGSSAERAPAQAPRPERPGRAPSVPTRMALQMAVALSLAFVAGFAVFPGHWAWAVLTAFIVCSGARGRGDAAYKAMLRLAGALAGTAAAALLAALVQPGGAFEAAAIFVVLFFGLWLRETNYAYWACAMTLVLALLSGGGLGTRLLAFRLEAILAGALCAVAATWFVFPIRTTDIVRRRLADALAALDEFVVHAHAEDERSVKLAAFEQHLHELDGVAAPVRLHRRFVRDDADHPARWIELTAALRVRATSFGLGERAADVQRTTIRKAIGASRRAIAEHGRPQSGGSTSIGAALARVREAFDGTQPPLDMP